MILTGSGRQFVYSWYHSPGSRTFEGVLLKPGSTKISDGTRITNATVIDREVRWKVPSGAGEWCSAEVDHGGAYLVKGKWWREDKTKLLGEFKGKKEDYDAGDVASPGPVSQLALDRMLASRGVIRPRASFGQRMRVARERKEKAEMADFIVGDESDSEKASSDFRFDGSGSSAGEDVALEDDADEESSLDEDRVALLRGATLKRPASSKAAGAAPGFQLRSGKRMRLKRLTV